MKIGDAIIDTNITGTEKIPADDNGLARAILLDDLKDFILSKMEPLDVEGTLDALFDTEEKDSVEDTDQVIVGSSFVESKFLTLLAIKEYVLANAQVEALDIDGLNSAGALADADVTFIMQGGQPRKTTLGTIQAKLLSAFKDYVLSLPEEVANDDEHVLYVVSQGNVQKKIKVGTLKAMLGNVSTDATTTENKVPQWDSGQKTLKDGLEVVTAITQGIEASDSKLPTEKAVADLLVNLGFATTANQVPAQGKVPVWGSTPKELEDGMSVVLSVREDGNAKDDSLATEKAVRSAVDEKLSAKGAKTQGNVPTWTSDGRLDGQGLSIASIVRAQGSATDERLASEKSVRAAIDNAVAGIEIGEGGGGGGGGASPFLLTLSEAHPISGNLFSPNMIEFKAEGDSNFSAFIPYMPIFPSPNYEENSTVMFEGFMPVGMSLSNVKIKLYCYIEGTFAAPTIDNKTAEFKLLVGEINYSGEFEIIRSYDGETKTFREADHQKPFETTFENIDLRSMHERDFRYLILYVYYDDSQFSFGGTLSVANCAVIPPIANGDNEGED